MFDVTEASPLHLLAGLLAFASLNHPEWIWKVKLGPRDIQGQVWGLTINLNTAHF